MGSVGTNGTRIVRDVCVRVYGCVLEEELSMRARIKSTAASRHL